MPEEKSIALQAPTTQAGVDPAREAAHSSQPEFSDRLMSAFNQANDALKGVAAPDLKPPRNIDRDVDPATLPVYDPKGLLGAATKGTPRGTAPNLNGNGTPSTATPTPTTPAKPTAATEDFPENAVSPEAKNSWQKLKADRDEKLRALSERETELLELKKRFDPVAFDKALKENEELTLQIRKLDVERHPRFRETYDKPIATAISSAKRVLPESFHADAEKWLTQPDSPQRDQVIQQITEQLPLAKQVMFVRYVEDAAVALEKRQSALQGESEFVTKYNQEQSAQAEAQRLQADAQARSVFKNVLTKNFADNPLLSTTDDASKDANSKRIARAEALLFGNNPPEALAEAVLLAEYGRDVQPLLIQAHDEIQRLTALLDKYAGKSAPTQSSSARAPSNDIGSRDFVDLIMEKANEQLRR